MPLKAIPACAGNKLIVVIIRDAPIRHWSAYNRLIIRGYRLMQKIHFAVLFQLFI